MARKGMRPEDQRTLKRLSYGMLAMAVVLIWVVASILSAPWFVAVFVALLYLCFAALTVTIVWYGYQRR